MKDMIVGKIRDLLTDLPIVDEPTLVYFLFLVCELGECDEAFELTVPNLHFYSSWILKKGLDRAAAKSILGAVEPILTLQERQTHPEWKRIGRLLTLQAFCDELRSMLVQNAIDVSLCDNVAYWERFLSVFSGAVQHKDFTLVGNAQSRGLLNLAVDCVTIHSVTGCSLSCDRPLPMEWSITYIDGRRGRLPLGHELLATSIVRFK